MGAHLFVDETKAKGYVVVVVTVPDEVLSLARSRLGRLVLPGQRSIHMKNEKPRRRSEIADVVCGLREHGVSAHVLDAGRGPEPEVDRRDRALRGVVTLAVERSPTNIVLDLDRTLERRDARTLSFAIREAGGSAITYSHDIPRAQPLLALPDVVAWSWARGNEWRRRIVPIVEDVIIV